MGNRLKPRPATPEETTELLEYTVIRWYGTAANDDTRSEWKELVDRAAIAVFDDYVTGGPGFAGKIMMVVWDGSPSQHEVYIWRDSTIQLVSPERES